MSQTNLDDGKEISISMSSMSGVAELIRSTKKVREIEFTYEGLQNTGSCADSSVHSMWGFTSDDSFGDNCAVDVGSESYCAKSTSVNCDGTTCTELSRAGATSLLDCQNKCRNFEGCNFISYTDVANDCLMYDACPALRQYGDGSQGTLSQSICTQCISSLYLEGSYFLIW